MYKMIKRPIHPAKSLVFRRWSRTAWAIQAAIGKQIRIGCLSVDICNAAYKKTVSCGTAISLLLAGRAAILSKNACLEGETPPDILIESIGTPCFLNLRILQNQHTKTSITSFARLCCETIHAFHKRTPIIENNYLGVRFFLHTNNNSKR